MNYLGVIENAEHVGTLNNAKIYKITNVNMIAFRVSEILSRVYMSLIIFCFVLFFSARSNCSVHKISDLTNQPFMAFSNNSTYVQIILQK